MSSQPITQATEPSQALSSYANQIEGKIILVTGVSPDGLGEQYCLDMAKHNPKLLIVAGRDTSKLGAILAKFADQFPHVATRQLQIDLTSIQDAERAATEVLGWNDVPHIDIMVNNAGIMAVDFGLTQDGFEKQLAVNYLTPWVFTNTLIPKIMASHQPRIVMVGSSGHRWGPVRWDDHNFKNGETYNRWRVYGQSKTAVGLYARSLASQLGPKLQVFSLDPGVVMTPLGAHVDWAEELENIRQIDLELGNKEAVDGWPAYKYRNKEDAVSTYLYASFGDIPAVHNGYYLSDGKVADPRHETLRPWARCNIEAERLWNWTQALVGKTFSF